MTLRLSRPRAKSRWAGAVGIVVLLTILATSLVSAAFATSTLNTLDGNLKIDVGDPNDWEGVAEIRRSDLPSGSGDNSFTQGTKEDTAEPVIEFGSIPPNKSDLKNFGIYKEKVGSVNYVHLYWTRVQDPSGTTNMDFELNAKFCDPAVGYPTDTDCTPNGVTPVRSIGDILITYDLSRGGTEPTLGYREWTGTAWGAFVDLTAAGKADGSINLVDIPSGEADGLGALSARTFGEASINLDAVLGTGSCRTLGSAYLKSRSSDSFPAALKDFIAPEEVAIGNCASLTIVKDAVPNDAQDFGFSATGPSSYSQTFTLDDDSGAVGADSTNDSQKALINLFAGDYFVTETGTPITGWDLTGISCPNSTVVYGRFTGNPATFGNGGSNGFDAGDTTLKITLAADDVKTCTFTNTKRGHIVVDKVTDPTGDTQSFDFTAGGTGYGNFSLTDAATPNDQEVVPGAYSVSEGSVAGWDLTSATCDKGETPASLDVEAGETVTCTFTNTKRGHIKLVKNTVGGNGTFPFTHSIAGLPASLLTAGGTANASSNALAPGTAYALAEGELPSGWAFTSASCTLEGGAATGSVSTKSVTGIAVEAGKTTTCTFTNTALYRAIVLVCNETNLDLYGSTVSLNGEAGKPSITTVNPADLAGYTGNADTLMAYLCGLGGAHFDDLPSNPSPAAVYGFGLRIPIPF